MVENFSGNNDSSIFVGKVRLEDLAAEQKLNELKGVADEIAKKIALKKVELEHEACGHVDAMFSQVELRIEEEDDHFAGGISGLLEELYEFFKPLFNEFDVNAEPGKYEMLKKKKEKNWLLSIIKFIQDKLKKLIKKIFSHDLSFNQKLDKEIKELEEKLFGGGLSKEEEIAILERLETLKGIKLKLQMFLVGWIVTMCAEIFGIELAAIVEASKEETAKVEEKKAEKTSLKEEANKEVHKEVEIKADEREKPKVPVSLFEVSPGFVRPIPLQKPELDLLPNHLKDLIPPIFKEVNENREVKETKPKVEEEKKAKPEEPKKEVCPPAPKTATETRQVIREPYGCDSDKKKKIEQDNNNTYQASSQSAQSFVSDKKASNQSASLVSNGKASNTQDSVIPSKDAPEQSARSSVADCECNFPIGFWKGPKHEGSVSNAQPPKGLTNPKVDEHVKTQSVGKT